MSAESDWREGKWFDHYRRMDPQGLLGLIESGMVDLSRRSRVLDGRTTPAAYSPEHPEYMTVLIEGEGTATTLLRIRRAGSVPKVWAADLDERVNLFDCIPVEPCPVSVHREDCEDWQYGDEDGDYYTPCLTCAEYRDHGNCPSCSWGRTLCGAHPNGHSPIY